MAEAIGLAASIFGIVGAVAKLSVGLYQIASTLKEAGNEIRLIATDTSLFSRVLRELALSISLPSYVHLRVCALADDLMHTCGTVQRDGGLLHTLEPLLPLVDRSQNRIQRVKLRIKWLFEKSKFIHHRENLCSLKLNLQLFISVIHLTHEPDVYVKGCLAHEVQSLKRSVEHSIELTQRNLQSPETMAQFSRPLPNLLGNETSSTADLAENQANKVPNGWVGPERATSVGTCHHNGATETGNSGEGSPDEINPLDCVEDEATVAPGPLVLRPQFHLLFVQEKVSQFAQDMLLVAPKPELWKERPPLPSPSKKYPPMLPEWCKERPSQPSLPKRYAPLPPEWKEPPSPPPVKSVPEWRRKPTQEWKKRAPLPDKEPSPEWWKEESQEAENTERTAGPHERTGDAEPFTKVFASPPSAVSDQYFFCPGDDISVSSLAERDSLNMHTRQVDSTLLPDELGPGNRGHGKRSSLRKDDSEYKELVELIQKHEDERIKREEEIRAREASQVEARKKAEEKVAALEAAASNERMEAEIRAKEELLKVKEEVYTALEMARKESEDARKAAEMKAEELSKVNDEARIALELVRKGVKDAKMEIEMERNRKWWKRYKADPAPSFTKLISAPN